MPNDMRGEIQMNEHKKVDQESSATAKQTERKPWEPMKLTLAGDAKDVIRHGTSKTSPGVGDPGEVLKNPQQG